VLVQPLWSEVVLVLTVPVVLSVVQMVVLVLEVVVVLLAGGLVLVLVLVCGLLVLQLLLLRLLLLLIEDPVVQVYWQLVVRSGDKLVSWCEGYFFLFLVSC